MATGTLSRGHDTLARAMAITEKPANTPWRRRARKSWVMEVTRPMAAMVTMKPARERTIMSLRPTRSARRPQSGPRSPASPGVMAMRTPDHTATSEGSVTPSSCTKRGRKGEKNWKPTHAVKTMRDAAQTLRRQPTGPGPAVIGGPRRRGRSLCRVLLDGGALHGEQLVEVGGRKRRGDGKRAPREKG